MKDNFNAFYQANTGLAHRVAVKVFARLMSMGAAVEFDDVFQEASLIMQRAYEKFDPSRGFKFSTYYTRSAYNELNKFVESYEKDCTVLGVMSIQAARGDDGDELDMESTIDGHHTSPEEALEHKQLFESIERKLSPLAFFLLQVSVDPPEQLVREFNVQRELGATHFVEMPMKFVIEYVSRLVNLPAIDLKVAGSEVNSFLRSVGA
jgi:RNA polymerase sigma factor (sigma-70 family)